MRRDSLLAVAAGVLVAAWAPPSHAADESPAKVVVTGTAKIRVSPDQAFVMLAVEARNANPREAQQQGAKASNAVLTELRSAKLGDRAIRTVSYGLQEEFDYDKGKRRSRGYLARNQIEVRVDAERQAGTSVSGGGELRTGERFEKHDEQQRSEDLGTDVEEVGERVEHVPLIGGTRERGHREPDRGDLLTWLRRRRHRGSSS